METTEGAAPSERLKETLVGTSPPAPKLRKGANESRFREEWLQAAITRLRPMFDKAGASVPDLGRAAIGFTSRGGKGTCVGECWCSTASADGHFEIFIRPDKADPVEVLGILCHELVHSAVPIGSGHGPIFKALALKIGLEGKMRHALPGMHLTEILKDLAADLGPLPHASLDIAFREQGKRKKQKTNMLKASCPGVVVDGKHEACPFICRLTAEHASKGAPYCGVHNVRMEIEWPEDESGDPKETPEGEDTGEALKPSAPPPSRPDPVPSPVFRPIREDEVLQPGAHVRMNIGTGETEVLTVPPVVSNHGELHE